MDHSPRPLDHKTAHDGLISRARSFVLSVVMEIEGRLPAGEGAIIPATLIRTLMQRWLIPAEAAMRRAILLIAAALPRAPQAAPAPPSAPPKTAPRKAPEGGPGKSPRTPVFSMKEPQGRSKAEDSAEDRLRRSLLLAAAMERPCPPLAPLRPLRSPAEEAARLQERFLSRLDALAFAMGNPEREAERFLRRQEKDAEKRRQAGAPPAPLAPPVSLRRPPGTGTETDPQFISLLMDLNAAVLPLFARPNTS
ncbi:MAG: hypothetical protein C0456_09630 [Hyphomonas sp.]|uniref:hypothetical protein n=1 Tax=Hyphomonas sp. TaxID=87 RepID=UPI001E09DC79|nr:hypothetical protein [Hyphomonas sp.]MBA4226878.1 hypothetical protein [Hyphomonas sp.]